MAITAISPSLNAEILPGASFAFTIDDTYTSLVIKVQTSTSLVNAYSTALGGGQSGYSVAVVDNGDGTHTVTTSADSGWDVSPQLIYVVEDETGTEATTSLSYDIIGEASFPKGELPYNPVTETTTGPLNNYNASVAPGVTDDADAGYTSGSAWVDIVADKSYRLTDPTAGAAVWIETSAGAGGGDVVGPASATDDAIVVYDGTTGKLIKNSTGTIAQITANTAKLTADTTNVTAAGALMDSEVDANLKTLVLPASTTISAFGATVVDDADAGAVRTTIDAARAMLSGAGAPGVSTGDGYPLGTTYADTTNDDGYILVDVTAGANVWSSGSGGVATDGTTAQDAVLLTERADHVNTPAAGKGELWLSNDATQKLMFTDDAGTDVWVNRRSHVIHMAGAGTNTTAGTWYGPHTSSHFSDLTGVYARGTGTHPTINVYSVYQPVPYDCTVTGIEHWMRANPVTGDGEFRFYRCEFTDGSSTITATQLGADADLAAFTNVGFAEDFSQTGLSVDLNKGDTIEAYWRSTTAAATFWYRIAITVEER